MSMLESQRIRPKKRQYKINKMEQRYYHMKFYFYFQMMNKNINIELGGKAYKATSPNKYVQKAYPTIGNGQGTVVVSTHRIAGKLSPSKYKSHTNQTSRNASILSSENSFIELQDSSILTGINPKKVQSPLRDTSNLTPTSPSRQFVRVNFINNSPNCSRTSSTHVREFRPSPNKMMGVQSRDGKEREEVLERKLKVLEGRIGELHKEKHELAGRLNEENRKVYHENTALKLKVNDLTKRIQRCMTPVATVDRRAEAEIQALKAEAKKMQQIIEGLTEKSESFVQECQQLNNQLLQSNQQSQQLKKQNNDLTKALKQKQQEYDSLHCQYLQLSEQKLQLLSLKEHYEQQLQQIHGSIAEAAKGNAMIVDEYECKLEEYRVAYDKNQEVIEQLSQQLQLAYAQLQPQPYPDSDQILNQESEGELALECKDLQNNFLQALEQRDQQVNALQSKNQQLLQQLAGKEQLIEELNSHIEEQAGRLEEVGAVLEKYTAKMNQMEARYEDLRQQHEQEKQRGTPISQKCKKCEELTKTIFRLNSHLNKRN